MLRTDVTPEVACLMLHHTVCDNKYYEVVLSAILRLRFETAVDVAINEYSCKRHVTVTLDVSEGATPELANDVADYVMAMKDDFTGDYFDTVRVGLEDVVVRERASA